MCWKRCSRSSRGEARFDAGSLPAWIEPGRGARVLLEGVAVGAFGELNAGESAARKLRQPCVLAELDAAQLLARPLRQPALRELSRFQAVSRDFSFVFPDNVAWGAVEDALRGRKIPELQEIAPMEVFRDPKGKAIDAGRYSLLTRVVFQSNERTLTEDDLTRWSDEVTSALTSLGGVQRA